MSQHMCLYVSIGVFIYDVIKIYSRSPLFRTPLSEHLLENKCCETLVRNIFWETRVANNSFATSSAKQVWRTARLQHLLGNKCCANRAFATSSGTQMLRAVSSRHLLGDKCRELLVHAIFWETNAANRAFATSSQEKQML
jgi:hypothetical protein